ncbi:MAG: HAD-IA family hydrolase [Sphingorhabdus sp.]|uniref:HAD-IA family hydrolase n=1 Tax=Sphingorhabdus sp. TaxID=1902408 RepID=UPI0025E3F70C|nr:HAD-IA family hydrolase [Sphingorhabdus sp.]MCO4092994.1 HAD-IA family hydrolase [Sphingorhabdus sp.]
MTKSRTRLAIFDCDGTLVDSQANICMAMEHTFEGAGRTPPLRQDIRRVVGLSLVESMRVLLPDADDKTHDELAEHYRGAFLNLRNSGLVDEPLYDGMAALLSELDEDGWNLGVATGKSDRGLIRCLDHHAITGLFVTLQTADRHPSKPHPSMVYQALADAGADARNAVVIGDTVYDIHMGRAAGTRTVGVNWGYHRVAELREAGADYIAESMDDLKAYLKDFA